MAIEIWHEREFVRKVLVVFGTRPEAIKMAPVVKSLNQCQDFNVRVCVTAQHREMLDQVLRIFEVKPDYDLDLMRERQDLNDITARVLVGVKTILRDFRPDILLVHGDTTTAMASALAGFYEQITIGHVEAGLRTRNMYAPWPEEANRQIIGRLARLHFAPTLSTRGNLIAEGVDPALIFVTGNTVIDALQEVLSRIERDADLHSSLRDRFRFLDESRRLIVVTGHRRENFGCGFENICAALERLAARKDIQIVYPVHLNPNVKEVVFRSLASETGIHLIEPLEYVPFAYLMKRAYLVLTDSGGVQEEAPSLGKPVLVMRENTERPEAVDAGTVRLVGTDRDRIIAGVTELLDDPDTYATMARAKNPYGDGMASRRIRDILRALPDGGGAAFEASL